MISKKVLGPALTGTGAVGASGTLAWTLGLLDEEILDDVVDGKVDVIKPDIDQKEKAPSGPEASAKQAEPAKEAKKDAPSRGTQGDQKTQTGAGGGSMGMGGVRMAGPSTWRRFFNDDGGASEFDRKVFDSGSTLEINRSVESLWINVEKGGDDDFSWKCQLKAISIEDVIDTNNEFEEFERQKKQLEAALKNDDHKKQFVANCSRSMANGEKQNGKNGVIELETDRITWRKYKFKEKEDYFQRLWTEDFTGIDKLSKEDEKNVKNKENWKIKEKTEGKVTISLGNVGSTCSIFGDYGGNLVGKTFKDSRLEEILKIEGHKQEIEKKRYLIRNCRKNSMEIKELKIKANGSNWWFEEESMKKISEGMYENPKAT